MTPANPVQDLVHQLQRSWPDWLAPVLPPCGVLEPSHPLAGEIQALLHGQAASLPFFPDENVIAWVTLGRDPEQLQEAYRDLRAWLLPSFAWEDSRGAFVPPASVSNPRIAALSPAGYLRWRTNRSVEDVHRVAARLCRARALADARPVHALQRTPSLLELRQQFVVALAAGDRTAAEEAIDLIDRHQFDTASNTLFLRLRVWDHFNDPTRIIELPDLELLLRLRLPHRVRVAICRAFYAGYLEDLEQAGDPAVVRETYAAAVDPRLGTQIELCGPEDGPAVRQLRGLRALVRNDAEAARRVLAEGASPLLQTLLAPLARPAPAPEPPLTLEQRFFEARKQQDWRAVQELGKQLRGDASEVLPILRKSLELCPNPGLEQWLQSQALVPVAPVNVPAVAATTPLPQTWSDWLTRLPTGPLEGLESFLDEHEPLDPGTLKGSALQPLLDALAELLTSPGQLPSSRERLLTTGLAELVTECLNDPGFPRPALLELYRLLTRAWDQWRRGSVFAPDGQVLLQLAEALLQLGQDRDQLGAEVLLAWWKARPVKALLPFLLGGVELFDRLSSEEETERLWVAAAAFLQKHRAQLTAGERRLWRQVGRRIGYPDDLLDEYVPVPTGVGAEEVDAIGAAGLGKIAVVSTRGEQAERAAEMLRERTDADVVVVTATHGGEQIKAALNADVIAYVWSASTHAIFRAFDKVDRKKIAYVKGTSAAGIVMAIERWVSDNGVAAAT
jgi:hypothetical protein